jgi:glycosyltransferase involved in cell wall biosynthesis
MEFFQKEIEPYVDGKNIVWLGEVTQEEKVRMLARARCFLFPIEWEEPFGLVMAEANACGTPVITTRWGAAPEVVEHGVTGFVADSLDEIPGFLKRIDEIDPAICREEVIRRFSPGSMAQGYLDIYQKVLSAR